MEKKTDEEIKEILGLTDEEIEFFDYIYGRECKFKATIVVLVFMILVAGTLLWLL